MDLLYLRNVTTLRLDREVCTGCRLCIHVCPRSVLAMEGKKARVVARDACIECGACSRNCISGAIAVKAGVGCAAAIINSKLGRKDACCVIDAEGDTSSSCC
jgi:ferredoxin